MAYCTASDVASVKKSLILGQGANPTASDVTNYCNMVGGEIDAILTTRGIAVPVAVASYPEAASFLQSVNVKGAVWMTLDAIGTNPTERDRAKMAYDAATKLLSDAKFTIDVPVDQDRAEVRAPWLTLQPTGQTYDPALDVTGGCSGDGISSGLTNQRSSPYFARNQQF